MTLEDYEVTPPLEIEPGGVPGGVREIRNLKLRGSCAFDGGVAPPGPYVIDPETAVESSFRLSYGRDVGYDEDGAIVARLSDCPGS